MSDAASSGEALPCFFLCIGFPKCGTTFLFEAIEASTHAVALRDPATGGAEIADGIFDCEGLDPRRSYVAKTPTWILDERCLRRLAATLSRRFRVVPVVCVRDPAEQLASYRAHRARVEGLAFPSMAQFCAARDCAAPALPYAACATFAPHLRAAIRVFGADALRVVHNDALRECDMPRLANFLSLPSLPDRAAPPPRARIPDDAFSPAERRHWRAAWRAALDVLAAAGVAALEPKAGLHLDPDDSGGALLPELSAE